ncbi:MAG: hypothetical protein R2708_05400 [Vicinamibacterales bacterium]
MTLLNALVTRLADLVMTPLAGLPPLAVLTGAAVATALVVLGVMRVTSNQAELAAVKRQIHAGLLEMRLYNDDLRGLLRAQRDVLWQNLRYVGYSLVPLLVTAVPLTLVIAQLQAWYGYQGLEPGVETAVTASVEGPVAAPPRLEAAGLEVVGTPRYFPTRHEVVWRVVPRAEGETVARVTTAAGTVVEKTVHVAAGASTARRSPSRSRAGVVDQLLYPSEAPLEDGSGIVAITVPYADRTLRLASFDVHWLIAYVALSVVAVLALRRPLGVVI